MISASNYIRWVSRIWRSKKAFKYLLPYYADVKETDTTFNIRKFVGEVETGDYDSFFSRLQTFFSNIPYDLVGDLEKHYQNVLLYYKLLDGILC